MFPFESLAIVYFVALALTAPFTRATRRNVWRMVATVAALVATILVAARWAPIDVRAWSGHIYLVMGYWLPALLVEKSSARTLDAWLALADTRLRRFAILVPSWVSTVLEISYLSCYVVIPIAFTVVWMRGDYLTINRFWLAVLGAGFLCYGSLPWLVSRPPRLMSPSRTSTAASSTVRGFNLFVLGRLSHGMNTFPSGHVAVSVAATLVVASISPSAALALGVVAAGIACGAVAGGYHYVVDVLLGAAVGIATAVIARIV